MDSLNWVGEVPQLRSPLLVCAFRGWNDAAGVASNALATLAESFDPEPIAEIDPEEFFDFQATRPTIVLSEGQTRRIDWPQNDLIAIRVPGAERDLVLFDGTEPSLRWRTFSETVATAADALGVEMVITLGALVAEVSHTLPVPITGLASDEQLIEELELALGGGAALRRRRPQPEGDAGAAAPARGADRDRGRSRRAGGGNRELRRADRPRRRRQSRDRRAGRADRGGAGRAVRRRGGRAALGRHDRARVPALPAAAPRRRELIPGGASGGWPASLTHASPSSGGFGRLAHPPARARSALGGGADQPVVAPAADARRGPRLEVLAQDPLADLQHRALDPLGVVGADRRRDLLGVEDVVVAAGARLDLPGLARRQPVEGELQVALQVCFALALSGLVVDQLVVAAREAVDAVDAPAHVVLADLDVELALQPDRRPLRLALALPVEAHRLAGAVAELQLVVAGAEPRAPPARLEEGHQPRQPVAVGVLLLVEALEDVVDEDAEALVDRRLLRDAEDAGELVLERAGQVEVEVGGREAEPAVAAPRQEALQRGLVTGGDQAPPALALPFGVEQVGVERRGVQLGLLLGRRDLAQQPVDRLDRLGGRLVAGALGQRRQLQQLQVAGDRAVDVHRRVEARLRELAAGLPGGLEHLLAQHPVGRVQPLGRAEQLLLVVLLLALGPGERRLVEGGGRELALLVALDPGEDEAGAGGTADPLGAGGVLEAGDEDVLELHPLGRAARQSLDRARRRGIDRAGRLDAGLGDRAQVADEVAGRTVRLAARPGGGQLSQPGQPEQPLGDLGLGGEEALAAQPDGLDQAPHEDVGAPLLQRRRGGPVELQEGLDPLARLGRDLRALQRRLAARDHVGLAAPRDRRQPRQVGGAQPDRRPGQRPRRRRRVGRVGEDAQPGDRVADLGALEEGRRTGEVEGDAALLHRRRDRAAAGRRVVDQDADLLGRRAGGDQVLGLAGDRLRLRALVGATPEADRRLPEAPLEHDRVALRVGGAVPGGDLGLVLQRVDVVGLVGGERGEDRPLRRHRVLELVHHQVRKAGGDLGAHVGPLGEQLVEGEEDVAAVEAAGRGEDAVVGGGQLAHLLVGRAGAGLQRVDPLQQPRQQAGRVAADLVGAQRQLVEAVEQHRQALRRPDHVEEGIESGCGRVLAQQALAELVPGADPELLVGRLERGFGPAPEAPRARP